MRLRRTSAICLLLFTFCFSAASEESPCDFIKQDKDSQKYSWPVKSFTVAKAMNSLVRGWAGWGDTFHRGVDLKTVYHETVCLPFSARITYLGGGELSGAEMNFIDEQGYEWGFAHLDHQTIPDSIKNALKDKSIIPAGTFLGRISFKEDESFHHLHLEVNLPDLGPSINPFSLFAELEDKEVPEILDLFRFSRKTEKLMAEISHSEKEYTIGLKVRDAVSASPYYIPPYRVSFSINDGPEHLVWQFEQSMPLNKEKVPYDDLAGKFFIPSLSCSEIYCDDFVIDLGFRISEGKSSYYLFPQNPGRHKIKVFVEDYASNRASKIFEWQIKE